MAAKGYILEALGSLVHFFCLVIKRRLRTMAKMMPKAEEDDFRRYLEQNVFNEELSDFKQFRGGMSSYTFFVKANSGHFVVKLLFAGVPDCKLLPRIATKAKEVPALRGVMTEKAFCYQGKNGIVQRYLGCALCRRRFSDELLAEVMETLGKMSSIEVFSDERERFDVYAPHKRYEELAEKLQADKSVRGRALSFFFKKIDPAALVYDKKQLKVIHGDFNNGQVLTQNGKLSAFIDWDSVRLGYETEDVFEFIYYNMRRIYDPFSFWYFLKRFVGKAALKVDATREEWLLAINAFFLRIVYQRYTGRFLLLKHGAKLLYFMVFAAVFWREMEKMAHLCRKS